MDLWEDFDVELLYKFYNNFLVVAHPDKADREPLSDWLKYLSPSVRSPPPLLLVIFLLRICQCFLTLVRVLIVCL